MRTCAHMVSVYTCGRVRAVPADDMSRVMCSCLHWVDGGSTWHVTYVCAVRLWGPDFVYASCVFLLLICNTLLGVSVAIPKLCVSVCAAGPLCVWHTVCDCVLTVCVFVICFVYTGHGWQVPVGQCVYIYVCVYVFSLLLLRQVR